MTMTMLYSWTFLSTTMFKRPLNIVTDTNSHGLFQIKTYIKQKNAIIKFMLIITNRTLNSRLASKYFIVCPGPFQCSFQFPIQFSSAFPHSCL